MWHSTQISKWNNAFKVCDRKPVFREQWGFTGCSSYGPLGEISHRRWWRKMGRCSLGEVTSKGSKGEERHEGLGVRLCEGSKVTLLGSYQVSHHTFVGAARRQETSGPATEVFVTIAHWAVWVPFPNPPPPPSLPGWHGRVRSDSAGGLHHSWGTLSLRILDFLEDDIVLIILPSAWEGSTLSVFQSFVHYPTSLKR